MQVPFSFCVLLILSGNKRYDRGAKNKRRPFGRRLFFALFIRNTSMQLHDLHPTVQCP